MPGLWLGNNVGAQEESNKPQDQNRSVALRPLPQLCPHMAAASFVSSMTTSGHTLRQYGVRYRGHRWVNTVSLKAQQQFGAGHLNLLRCNNTKNLIQRIIRLSSG